MPYTPDDACLAAARAAAGEDLPESEIHGAFQRISDYRDSLIAQGKTAGMEQKLRRFATEEGERATAYAKVQKQNAARNIIVHDKLMDQVKTFIAGGIRPRDALLAVLEGTQRGIKNARRSVAAQVLSYRKDYIGSMLSELQRDAAHILPLLHDPKLDADTLAEMMELKDNGHPGVTGNADAKYLAKTFAKYAELARREHNKLGGFMGKLDGWAGVQMHDDYKMIQGGDEARDRWIGYVLTKLDLERTFPDGLTPTEVHDALGSMYDTITTGVAATPGAAEQGKYVGPSSLAKSFAASRVLHFKDAATTLDYREKYGYSNTIGGMLAHLNRVAKVNGIMSVLGPNPEVMFNALAAEVQRSIRDAKEIPQADVVYGKKLGLFGGHTPTLEEWRRREARLIDTQAGVLRQGMDIATGLASKPADVTMADIGSNIRAVQSMAKLGAALPSSFADVPTVAVSALFRGSPFFRTITDQLGGIMTHGDQENREISYLLGEGFEGLIGHINSIMSGNDRVRGIASILMEKFFKWNGLTWWTDAGRASAARIVASEAGMRAATAWKDLPPKYSHVLGMNGIDAARWDVMRQASMISANGKTYLTPDRIMALSDDQVAPLVGDRLANRTPEQRAFIIGQARRDLALDYRRFVADETNYGVIVGDARSQRTTTWGTRPGTKGGEAIRQIMQFKAFPIAYAERVLGRAAYGARADASVGERAAHIGSILGGLTVAGYMAMTMKDMLKGYWPPRNPADPRTILASIQQGGAVGIYGDYLFGSTNRFGGSLLETLAGPSLGSASQLGDILLDARDAAATGGQDKFSASRAFSTILGQVPFANLHFVKPALDFLYLNSIREALSPGFMRKQADDRQKQYHQSTIGGAIGAPVSLDPQNITPSF